MADLLGIVKYTSTSSIAFAGRIDKLILDQCEGMHFRSYITPYILSEIVVTSEAMRVATAHLYSPVSLQSEINKNQTVDLSSLEKLMLKTPFFFLSGQQSYEKYIDTTGLNSLMGNNIGNKISMTNNALQAILKPQLEVI